MIYRDAAYSTTGSVALLTSRKLLVDTDGINLGADPLDVTSSLPLTVPADGDTPASTRQPRFGGVMVAADGALWLSDTEGYLYRSEDFGTTWTINGVAAAEAATNYPEAYTTSNEVPLPFTDFAEVDNGGSPLIVVGTDGYGYRELVSGVPAIPAAASSNYQASGLAEGSVLAFHVHSGAGGYVPNASGDNFTLEADGDRLFAGTSGLGLWKTLYYGAAPQWLRE
jgi:hypothetical protein